MHRISTLFKITLFFFFVLLSLFANSQTIVFEEGFEGDTCTWEYCNSNNSIEKFTDNWYSPNFATPDLICPKNSERISGDQFVLEPKFDSMSLGLIFSKGKKVDWAEYGQTQLKHPLKKGHQYYIEFWVSANCRYKSIPSFGIYFSKDSLIKKKLEKSNFKVQPQIYTNCRLTRRWKKISGYFSPEEDKEFLTIGVFDDAKIKSGRFYFSVDNILIKEIFDKNEIEEDDTFCFEPGDKIELKIEFETGSAAILKESFSVLKKFARTLKSLPNILVQIEGHTDSRGDDDENQLLSEERAKSVYDFLIKNGAKSNQLRSKGFGESQPITTNETESGRQKNRRVIANVLESLSPPEVYLRACKKSLNNELDSAFYFLKTAIIAGIDDPVILVDPDLKNMKKDPRWKGIVGTIKNIFASNSHRSLKKDLAFKLVMIYYEDQLIADDSYSNFWSFKGRDYPYDTTLHADTLNAKKVNERHQKIIERLFEDDQLPWRVQISSKGYDGIFVVVQHSGNVALMEKYLKKFEREAKHDKNLLWHTAYLADRLRTIQNLPQLYGTQYRRDGSGYAPIEDPENLNERRVEKGLEPFSEKQLEKVLNKN